MDKMYDSSIMVSFVIPVYNVEEYILECAESILRQCSMNMEVILVDDGSTDQSGLLCDQLAERSSIVRVIHQKNSGHSAARNVGLQIARGKYVAFVDSDDFIGENCLELILDWAEKQAAEVCFLNGYKFFPNGEIQKLDLLPDREQVLNKSPTEVLERVSLCSKFPGSACTKLFKRSFLMENGIKFPSNILHGEDLRFVAQCFVMAESFDCLALDYYFYRQGRNGSVSSSVNKEHIFKDLADFIIYMVRLGEKYPEKAKALYGMAAYEYIVVLYTYCTLLGKTKSNAKKFFIEYQWLLRYGKSRKIKLVQYCMAIFGIGFTSWLINIWLRIR